MDVVEKLRGLMDCGAVTEWYPTSPLVLVV